MKKIILLSSLLIWGVYAHAAPPPSEDIDYNSATLLYSSNNYKKALQQFKTCQDDERCLYMAGVMYEKGEGVAVDYAAAAQWYAKAADKGSPAAMYMLGKLYENGNGVDENRQEALSLYRKAAAKRYQAAVRRLKELNEPLVEKKIGPNMKKY